MSIRDRLLEAGILVERKELPEDDYGIEVNLFEKHEFKVFMQFAKIYADPNKIIGAVHYISMYGIDDNVFQFPKGRTPMEIAFYLYNYGLGHGEDAKIFEHLEFLYDTWAHYFMPEAVTEFPIPEEMRDLPEY